jgi:protein SMG8
MKIFYANVRGPLTEIHGNILSDTLDRIWQSGRQKCDAISLTGHPCKHRVSFYFFFIC